LSIFKNAFLLYTICKGSIKDGQSITFNFIFQNAKTNLNKGNNSMKKTALYEQHVKMNAKTGEFAEYDMPLYYPEGVIAEHEWVRSQAGLFDVSHMGQIILTGENVHEFLEKITPSAFEKLPSGRAKYTVMTNEEGGIIDDLIITRISDDSFFAVINAGCKQKDINWIKDNLPSNLNLEILDDRSLIALQGPLAESVLLETLGFDSTDMPYMWLNEFKDYYISRLGYTGEDGFEISVKNEDASELWDKLTKNKKVKPIGLAARDSLRLEMGYCLYGHDIDSKTTPIEAGLSWVMGKNNTSFIGSETILPQKSEGPAKVRTGFKLIDKGIAREGALILDSNNQEIGIVTSGGFSPSLKQAIGQGYIKTEKLQFEENIHIDVRGKKIKAMLCKLPLLPAKTKSMKKKAA
jgi:aminomethyltransferase